MSPGLRSAHYGTVGMTTEESIVRIVLRVPRMGEADLFGRWRSHGLTEAGKTADLPGNLRGGDQ